MNDERNERELSMENREEKERRQGVKDEHGEETAQMNAQAAGVESVSGESSGETESGNVDSQGRASGERAGEASSEKAAYSEEDSRPDEDEGGSEPENGAADDNGLSRLREEIEALISEKESYHRQLLRLQADFDNYRKRVNREKEKIAFNTKVNLLDDILPVIDNFERALGSFNADDEYTRGVEMIYRQLLKFLEKNGVEAIPAEGEHFDHNLHEAVMQVEDSETESGVIIEELQKGYILDDRVIRPAMVKVSS